MGALPASGSGVQACARGRRRVRTINHDGRLLQAAAERAERQGAQPGAAPRVNVHPLDPHAALLDLPREVRPGSSLVAGGEGPQGAGPEEQGPRSRRIGSGLFTAEQGHRAAHSLQRDCGDQAHRTPPDDRDPRRSEVEHIKTLPDPPPAEDR